VRNGDSTSDAELLRAAQRGSETAWETLYRRYLPGVWRYVCTRLRGNLHAAEDVLSETFLAAVEGLNKLDVDGRPLYPWLVGIAKNKVADYWRRANRSGVDPGGPGAEPLDAVDPACPHLGLVASENRMLVARAMARLSDEERLILEWKYVDELSVRQIARRMSRTQKAVENLLYRARNSLRAILRERPSDRSAQSSNP